MCSYWMYGWMKWLRDWLLWGDLLTDIDTDTMMEHQFIAILSKDTQKFLPLSNAFHMMAFSLHRCLETMLKSQY